MKVTEEILNKYIDGELQPEILEGLNEHLANSKEDLERLRAMQALHRSLKKIKVEETSNDFTHSVMFRINQKNKAAIQQKYFIGIVSAVFVLFSLAIVGYILYLISGFSNTEDKVGDTLTFIKSYTETITSPLKKIFSGKYVTVIGSILSMGILGSAYFFFESFKRIKNNFNG